MSIEESHDIPGDCDGTQSVLGDDMSRDRIIVSARWASALRRLMDQRSMTQMDLATLAGVDKDTVTNIMHGESSSTATLEKLAQALGVDISELVLTAEQSRMLTESRVRGEDLARRISKELSASILGAGSLASAVGSAGPATPTEPADSADQERRSGSDRRHTSAGRTGRGRRT